MSPFASMFDQHSVSISNDHTEEGNQTTNGKLC